MLFGVDELDDLLEVHDPLLRELQEPGGQATDHKLLLSEQLMS